MSESLAGKERTWSQRVDPWMILWPMMLVGLGATGLFLFVVVAAVALPIYIEGSSNLVDQMVLAGLGDLNSRVAAIAVAVTGVAVGYVAYSALTKNAHSSDRTVRTISRGFAWVGLAWLVISYLSYALMGYPYAVSASFSRFMADASFGFLGGIMMVVGMGHVLAYREFSARARATGGHVGAYVVRTGEAPGVIEKATSTIGGSFYMLLDPRVKRIELHVVPVDLNYQLRKQVSPDEVRRDQHLTW